MTITQIISISLISAILAAVLLVGVTRVVGAYAGPVAQMSGMSHQVGHRRGGWGGHGRGLARLCSDRRDERIGQAIGFIETFVDFNDAQMAAWGKLTDAVRNGSSKVGEACKEFAQTGEAKTAPEKMARVELMLGKGLEIMQEVRPAFNEFYAVLDNEQKRALDDLLDRHRR